MNAEKKTGKFTECLKFGARIRELRHHVGVTQAVLSHRAKIHQTYLAGIESGARNPTIIIVVKLARALKVKPSELLANQ